MAQVSMPQVDALRETMDEPVRDMKLNLGNIASSDFLEAEQIWGVALTSAIYIGEPKLRGALLADAAAAGVNQNLLDDARSAAALMGMNTVYYRFRHLIARESYSHMPARLRMQVMVKPKTNKTNFELFSLAVAVLAGCETCMKAHEAKVIEGGMTEEQVHDAVRLASILNGAATALRG